MSNFSLTQRAKLWCLNLPRQFNHWYHSGFGRHDFNPNGIDIMSEDWDNLLILDACRYDTFSEVSNLPGTLNRQISRSSTTQEFLRANLGKRDLRDTVYVTATPAIHATENVEPEFHAVIDVWQDHWDSELRVVPPEPVTAAEIAANERYPRKRLLVHYLQPHYPFIGSTGRKYFDNEAVDNPTDKNENEINAKFWDTVGTEINDVSEEIVRKAYRENIELTLPHINNFFDSVDGRTVVTANHGEMLNDRASPIPYRLYGHPPGLYTPELVEIPWHVYSRGSRRKVTAADSTIDDTEINSKVVKDRLRDLAYT